MNKQICFIPCYSENITILFYDKYQFIEETDQRVCDVKLGRGSIQKKIIIDKKGPLSAD